MANIVKITLQAIDNASATLSNISKQLGAIGTMGMGASIGIAKTYADLERILGGTAAVAGWTAEEMDKMGKFARNAALSTATSMTDAMNAMYDFASAGV